MRRLERVLTRVLESVLAACLLAIATLVVTLVVMRYVFNSSITGANEAITILFVYTTAIGAAIAIGKREHIAIAVAVNSLPTRWQQVTDAVALVLIAVLNATMLVFSVRWIQVTGQFLMPTTGLPRLVAQLCIPLGCSLAVFYCIAKLSMLRDGSANQIRSESERGGE